MKTEKEVRGMKENILFARSAWKDDVLFDQKTMYAVNLLDYILEQDATFKSSDFAKSIILFTKQSEVKIE